MTGAVLIQNPGPSPFFSDLGPELGTDPGANVRCENGHIAAIGTQLKLRPNELCIDAKGGALLPGLHDHHIHLLATAAARRSLDCRADSAEPFLARLETHAQLARESGESYGWVRAVNYHESIAGELNRDRLDELVPHQPVKIQHSTGSMWVLNSPALNLLGLHELQDERIERDANNHPTGRLFRADDLLRASGAASAPDLTALSLELASYGVTAVTDTSANNSAAELDLLRAKQAQGELLQRVRLMGCADLPELREPGFRTGELKLLLDEANLPDIDELIAQVERAHDNGRGVAFHCVTRIELALVISVLSSTGVRGDRIEHASVVPAGTIAQLAELGVRVVTQPGLIYTRGDRYVQDLEHSDLQMLYRLHSLQRQGIAIAGSSDAPYGPIDPWRSMQCAHDRRTQAGAQIGAEEAISAQAALALYCTQPIAVGQQADLCVLTQSWRDAARHLANVQVSHTLRNGKLIYCRD